MSSKDKMVNRVVVNLSPNENGGESLVFSSELYDNGDSTHNIYQVQSLTLNSYSNSATFHLTGSILTPESLRNLADALEKAEQEFTRK